MKHGGAPPIANAGQRNDWLDLSTGINPHSYPIPKLNNAEWENLPRQSDMESLLSAARRYYSVPDSCGIVAVPGTEAAISQLPVFHSGSIGILEPTYASHRAAWTADGRTAVSLDTLPSGPIENHLLIVNPNNPTGRLFSSGELLTAAEQLACGRIMVVDEAFMDCAPDSSIVSHLQPETPIIVLKSFGKFFGLAGLRLGFVIGKPEILRKLSVRFGEWCISGPALKIGHAALSNGNWQSGMRARLRADMNRLECLMKNRDQIVGKTHLFLTYRHKDALTLHKFLAERNIWTRYFAYEPTWLRFGLPGSDTEFGRFAKGLSDFEDQFGGS